MKRYYVELKRNLKEKDSISFYMMAYNRTQIMDMLWDEYYVVAVDPTEQEIHMNLIELEKKIKEHEVIQKFKDGVTDAMLHGTRDEKQSHHYYKQGYDFGIDLFCKQEEWTHD